VTCPACGSQNPSGQKFCGECGAQLVGNAAPPAGPASERRLVSVLFADLVGFTTLSEAERSSSRRPRSAVSTTSTSSLGRIDAIPPGKRPPFLAAEAARFRARVASARGAGDGVEQGFKTASAIFLEHGLTFFLAVTQLEHGEWLGVEGRGDEAEPLLAEAREVFERLEAAPWLERADAVQPGLARIGAEAS
jgi:hypothetical protein